MEKHSNVTLHLEALLTMQGRTNGIGAPTSRSSLEKADSITKGNVLLIMLVVPVPMITLNSWIFLFTRCIKAGSSDKEDEAIRGREMRLETMTRAMTD